MKSLVALLSSYCYLCIYVYRICENNATFVIVVCGKDQRKLAMLKYNAKRYNACKMFALYVFAASGNVSLYILFGQQ